MVVRKWFGKVILEQFGNSMALEFVISTSLHSEFCACHI